MSRIDIYKNRLGEMFLRDRGNVDEKTANMIKSEVRRTLERYFTVSEFNAELSPCDDGEVLITLSVKGRRMYSDI